MSNEMRKLINIIENVGDSKDLAEYYDLIGGGKNLKDEELFFLEYFGPKHAKALIRIFYNYGLGGGDSYDAVSATHPITEEAVPVIEYFRQNPNLYLDPTFMSGVRKMLKHRFSDGVYKLVLGIAGTKSVFELINFLSEEKVRHGVINSYNIDTSSPEGFKQLLSVVPEVPNKKVFQMIISKNIKNIGSMYFGDQTFVGDENDDDL